ncbi:MAG: hypothetical protein P8045_17245, partial [Candidatus Thiodiazotropha sp.]
MCWNDTKSGAGRVIGNAFESGFSPIWGSERHREICRTMKADEVCNNNQGCHCRMVSYQQAASHLRLFEATEENHDLILPNDIYF